MYGTWSLWSECDRTCGGGSRVRSRSCTNPPVQFGGSDCASLGPEQETQLCSLNSCPGKRVVFGGGGREESLLAGLGNICFFFGLKKGLSFLSNILERILKCDEKLEFSLVKCHRNMGKLIPVVFGEIKMSLLCTKKGQLGFSERQQRLINSVISFRSLEISATLIFSKIIRTDQTVFTQIYL